MMQASEGHATAQRRWKGFQRISVSGFLVSLIVMLIALPFVEGLPYGILVESVLLTAVLLSAVCAVADRRRTLVGAAVLVVPAIAGRWLSHLFENPLILDAARVLGLAFIGYVVFHLLQFIFRSKQVDSEVLCAGIATYLVLGLFWSFTYALTDHLLPGSFTCNGGPFVMKGFSVIYYSFVTLATMGYGDIVPASGPARMLAMMEGITGVFYTTVLIARLVGLHLVHHSEKNRFS